MGTSKMGCLCDSLWREGSHRAKHQIPKKVLLSPLLRKTHPVPHSSGKSISDIPFT